MLFSAVSQGFGRFSYALVIPALIRTTLHSVALAGTLGTVNVGAYLLGSITVTVVSKRVGPATLIRLGLVLSTAGILTFAASNAFWLFALAMVAAGFGGALIWIPSPGIAASAVVGNRKAWAMGMTGAGIGLAITFSGQVARVLTKLPGLWSWKALWLIEGLIAIVALGAAFGPLRRVNYAMPGADSGIGVQDSASRDGLASEPEPVRVKVPGRTLLTLIYMVYGLVQGVFLTFVVTALERDHSYSAGSASFIFAIVGFFSIFGGIMSGRISDRISNRAAVIGVAFVAMALACYSITNGSLAEVIPGAVLYGLGMSGIPNLVAAHLGDHLPPQGFAAAFALVTLFFGIAQAVGPQIGGLLEVHSGSFRLEYYLLGGFSLLGAGLSFGLNLAGRSPRQS